MYKRKNIVFLAHRFPYPLDKGERIRMFHLLSKLSEKNNLFIFSLADEPVELKNIETIQKLCQQLDVLYLHKKDKIFAALRSLISKKSATEHYFASMRIKKRIAHLIQKVEPECILGSSSGIMANVLSTPSISATTEIFCDMMDIDSEKWLSYANKSSGIGRSIKSSFYKSESKKTSELESLICKNAKATFLVNKNDTKQLKTKTHSENVHHVPNGVDLEFFKATSKNFKKFSCVFVGAMDYKPNIEGMIWFCKRVWPTIQDEFPDANFTIVGRNPHPTVLELRKNSSVSVTGSVADVRPFIQDAQIVVAPLFIAQGIQNKVLEAMAMSKAIVMTTGAANGIRVENNSNSIICDTPSEWVVNITQLFLNPSRVLNLGYEANKTIRSYYHWKQSLQPAIDCIEG